MVAVLDVALVVVGSGLVVAGLAHAVLPRALGWDSTTHRSAGPLGALVVSMHVYFVGLFLVVLGAVTITVGFSPPSVTGQVVLAGSAVVFLVRWVVEVVAVPRTLAAAPPLFAVLHRFALVAWLVVAAVYAAAFVRSLA